MSSFIHNSIKYEIASPCDQSWDDMSGDDKCRHCSLCDKNVYDLSKMSGSEVTALISSGENVCTKVYRRSDGTILTEDCPIGLQKVKKHLREKQFVAAVLCLLTIIFTSTAEAGKNRLMGKIAPAYYQQTITEPAPQKEIETVGPEENWDYENKEKINIEDEEVMMGELIALPQE